MHVPWLHYGRDNIYFEKKINFEMDTIILKLIENLLIKIKYLKANKNKFNKLKKMHIKVIKNITQMKNL